MFQCYTYFVGVATRESNGYEDRVEVVEVEVSDRTVESEATCGEVLVGDGIVCDGEGGGVGKGGRVGGVAKEGVERGGEVAVEEHFLRWEDVEK